MPNIIPVGKADAYSDEFALGEGKEATLYLTPGAEGELPPQCWASVQIKSAASRWIAVGSLTYAKPAQVLSGAGTYRVFRSEASSICGVDRD